MDNERLFMSQILKQPDIAFKTTLKDADFKHHRELFITIRSMLQEGMTIDIPTISKTNSNIKVSDLISIEDEAVTPVNWQFYEKQIKERNRKFTILSACEQALRSTTMDADAITHDLLQAIDDYRDSDEFHIVPIQESLHETVNEIETSFKTHELKGVKTGFSTLDRRFDGFQKRRLYIVGARPSQGKTALLINFILHADSRVGFISAESGRHEADLRLMSLGTKINSEKVAKGAMSEMEFNKLTHTCGWLNEKQIWYYDEPNIDIEILKLKAREMKQRFDIQALYIDYVQQIQGTANSDHERVAKVSTALKGLARKLDIPVIAAAQLRRPPEGRRSAPELHDLGNSGQIERDADAVILIHHGKLNDKEGSYLLVEKNRDGETGAVEVTFKREHYGFYDIER